MYVKDGQHSEQWNLSLQSGESVYICITYRMYVAGNYFNM